MQTADAQAEMFFRSEWFPSEMGLLLPPEDISTAEYSERYRYVVKSARPGQWRNANNPPLVGIMNAADQKGAFKNLRCEVICKGVQTGGSEGVYNIKHKRMDNSANNLLLVMENERKVRRVSRQRLLENIKRHGRLAAQLSNNPDDTTNYSVIMRTGFCLNIGWAGSQAAVASDPCETVILDEIDKYEVLMNIEEAKDRITTYNETGLVVIVSTPGLDGGPIMAELASCDTVMDYHVECPDCGSVQIMDFEHFWWPDKNIAIADQEGRRKLANRILREKLARYACGSCGSLWDDYGRDKAVRLGARHHFHGWRMREVIEYPVSVGFHFPSWISPFKSLSHVVARWLKAQEPGQMPKLRAWYNQEAAEPFIEGSAAISAEVLYARREVYAADVPKDVLILTAGIDVQKEWIECEVKGWGPGRENWAVAHKIINGSFLEEATQNALDDFLLKTWRHESGALMSVVRVAIDSGDGNYASQIYAFCKAREGRGVYAVKGSSNPRADILDGRLVRRKDAIFQKIGVTACKDILFGCLALQDPGPGYMHFPVSYDKEYFDQFSAERPVISKTGKRLYEKIAGRRNEAIDLNNYNLAALTMYNPDWESLRRRGIGEGDSTRLVYRHHSRDKHLDESIVLKPDFPVVVCCDFGKTPLIWPLCQTDGKKVWCFDEIVIRNASTMDMGMELLRRYGKHQKGFIIYGSAAGTLRSPVRKSDYAVLKDLGFARQAVKTVNPLLSDRVNAVNNMLEDLPGRARLSYHPDCINLRKDFEQAIWLEDMSEIDRTDSGRGNATDALGYFINYEWPLKTARPNPGRRFYK